jgi:hypothetical protein
MFTILISHNRLTTDSNSFIGEMVTKATYGEQVWDEMGKDLSQWNKEAMDLLTEAAFFFFPVNVFKSRG